MAIHKCQAHMCCWMCPWVCKCESNCQWQTCGRR